LKIEICPEVTNIRDNREPTDIYSYTHSKDNYDIFSKTTMAQKVLVLGAGELGLAVIEALARHPLYSQCSLAVLLRQSSLDTALPSKKKLTQHLKALGCSFEAAEVAAAPVEELSAIFKKYDTVISCNGMYLPPGTQQKLCQAVFDAGVKRYFPWQFGMDYDIIGEGSSQDLFDEQLEVRKMLRAQDKVKWTIVSVGVFMSFLFQPFKIIDIDDKTVRGLGSWDTRITSTTPQDIGRVTADLILDPRDTAEESGVVFVAGDTISYAQMADLVDERFGEKFKRELLDRETLKNSLQEENVDPLVKYKDTFAQGRGVSWELERTVNYQRGMDMTDLRQYLEGVKSPDEQ